MQRGCAQPRIYNGRFRDQRTACDHPFDRAIGVELLNASLHFAQGGTFEDLSTGIWADQINDVNGAFFIQSADFINCARAIHTTETSASPSRTATLRFRGQRLAPQRGLC